MLKNWLEKNLMCVFFYVDVDEYEDISGSDGYNISKLPTFLIFKKGKEPMRLEGSYIDALRKSI